MVQQQQQQLLHAAAAIPNTAASSCTAMIAPVLFVDTVIANQRYAEGCQLQAGCQPQQSRCIQLHCTCVVCVHVWLAAQQ
jgi:hypothetical protein